MKKTFLKKIKWRRRQRFFSHILKKLSWLIKREKNEKESRVADPDTQKTSVYQKYENQFGKHAGIVE